MKKLFKLLLGMVKWSFIVLFLFLLSLFFRQQQIPQFILSELAEAVAPTNVVLHVESVSFGIRHGLTARNFRLYEREKLNAGSMEPMVSAASIDIFPFSRRVEIEGLKYPRLPESYYAPGNCEKNARVEASLPVIPRFALVLIRPEVLSLKPERVIADVEVEGDRVEVSRMRLDWPDKDEPMFVEGGCTVDLRSQEVTGEARGSAKQSHIRPFLVALDIPSALTYVDAFTDVPGKVPTDCTWHVNLVNNDFDMVLDLDPSLGKYNGVPMRHANGKVCLHVYTRGNFMNYHHEIGPIVATGARGQPLEGSVTVDGLNGTNTITLTATSGLPVAHLLKIGGFTGDYMAEDVVGESSCQLEFRFPREKCGDNAYLNGKGHVEVCNGQLMRLKGFKGLLELLAEKVPGVSWLTDSTQATCDYVIENGVIRTDNFYLEGGFYSLKMYGAFDSVRDNLDYVVRVQFTRQDSILGHILHPLTWPFTKLLLEFRLTGTTENPQWEYITVLDRVLGVTK